jgi:hypothetical protein
VWVALLALVAACSFEHGQLVGAGGDDAGGDDAAGPGSDAAGLTTIKLTFDNSASNVDFGPHSVLVALDASKIDYAAIADPTTDLRFEYAKDGTTAHVGDPVPFEIEKWDPTGESIVWIRVPEILAHSTDTAVLMHYGRDAGGLASASATWMSWELVNHMATGLTSSAGAYTPTPINTMFTAGQMGEGVSFAGTGDERITFANGGALFNGWVAWTLQFWLYVDYGGAAELGMSQPPVMDKGTSLTLGRVYASGADIRFQVDLHFSNSTVYAYLVSVPPRTWTMCTITSDGSTLYIAKNGNAFGTADLSGNNQPLLGSTMPFYLGATNNPFKGRIDELRIERRNRGNDWVHAQYLNMTRQFVTFSAP